MFATRATIVAEVLKRTLFRTVVQSTFQGEFKYVKSIRLPLKFFIKTHTPNIFYHCNCQFPELLNCHGAYVG